MRKTELISGEDPQAVERAAQVLETGGLVAFPTDTVYGLAASAFSEEAIDKLFEAKGRETTKAIAVLLGDLDQLPRMTPGLSTPARQLAEHYWPGPLTLVVNRVPGLPENLSPLPTIGLRIPDHPFALALLRCTGPLATTSANQSGMANALTAEEVLRQLDGQIDLVIDGGRTPGGVPSTVVDCTGEQLRVLREGPIPPSELYDKSE